MTYSGVVVLPTLFWVIHELTSGYAAAFGLFLRKPRRS